MDTSKIIGEDGNGKDIGNMTQDGGKADTKYVEEILDTRARRHLVDLTNLRDHRTMEATVMVRALVNK
jgi:hypothetical protein